MTDPKEPVIAINNSVAVPAIRTGLQVVSGEFVVQGLELWVTTFTDDQRAWMVIAMSLVLAGLQNLAEHLKGRRLLGIPL